MEEDAIPPSRPNPATPVRRRRWFRTAAWGVAGLALLTAVSYFAVPPLARHLLVGKLGEALHRPVAVREIRFNPLQLSLTVSGFTLGEREGGGEFLGFDELFVDLEAVSIVSRAPVVREVRLRAPRVHVVRFADGRAYNFSDLLRGASKAPAAGAATQREGPARFAVHNIRVSGGRIAFEDRPRGADHEVSEIKLTIPFISNFAAHVDTFEQPALAARVNGAPFRITGRTKPFKETLETAVDIDLKQIDIPHYLSYLPADFGFTVREGWLGTKLSVSFSNPPEGRLLLVRGAVRLDQVAVAETAGAPLISFALAGIRDSRRGPRRLGPRPSRGRRRRPGVRPHRSRGTARGVEGARARGDRRLPDADGARALGGRPPSDSCAGKAAGSSRAWRSPGRSRPPGRLRRRLRRRRPQRRRLQPRNRPPTPNRRG